MSPRDPTGGMFPCAYAIEADVYTAGTGAEFDSESAAIADAMTRLTLASSGSVSGTIPGASVHLNRGLGFGVDGYTYTASAQRAVYRFRSYTASCYSKVIWDQVPSASFRIALEDGPPFFEDGTLDGDPTEGVWTQPPADYDGSHIDGAFSVDDPTTWALSDDVALDVTDLIGPTEYVFKTVTLSVPRFVWSFVDGWVPPKDGTAPLGGIPEPI